MKTILSVQLGRTLRPSHDVVRTFSLALEVPRERKSIPLLLADNGPRFVVCQRRLISELLRLAGHRGEALSTLTGLALIDGNTDHVVGR